MAVGVLVAVVAHALLGWQWTTLGGIVAGYLSLRTPVRAGTIAGVAAWAVVIAYDFAVDARAVSEMTRVVAALLGGLPAVATVVVTAAIGGLLGACGGWIGGSVRNLQAPRRR